MDCSFHAVVVLLLTGMSKQMRECWSIMALVAAEHVYFMALVAAEHVYLIPGLLKV